MGEYERKQMLQLSRTIANSKPKSNKLKRITVNKSKTTTFIKQCLSLSNRPLNNDIDIIQRAISYASFSLNKDSLGRGISAEVKGLHGKTLAPGTNSPSVYPPGWKWLSDNGFSNWWVRMHLWNGRLGGPGNMVENLTPGPKKDNTMMYFDGEKGAQQAVDARETIDLRATASYNGWVDNPKGAMESGHKISELIPTKIDLFWRSQTSSKTGAWDTDNDPNDCLAQRYQEILNTKGVDP